MGSRIYVSTRVGPFRVGTSVGGSAGRAPTRRPTRPVVKGKPAAVTTPKAESRPGPVIALTCIAIGFVTMPFAWPISLLLFVVVFVVSVREIGPARRRAQAKAAAATADRQPQVDLTEHLTAEDVAWLEQHGWQRPQ